jgi:hypothetical protein
VPAPRLSTIASEQPNAFATGRTERSSMRRRSDNDRRFEAPQGTQRAPEAAI